MSFILTRNLKLGIDWRRRECRGYKRQKMSESFNLYSLRKDRFAWGLISTQTS